MKHFIAAAAAAALILGQLGGPARAAGTDGWTVTQLLGGASGTDHRAVHDVAATSPTDAWAVGGQLRNLRGVPFVQHWNGTEWSEVALPADLVGSLDTVTASSATDVWVFGNENSPTYRPYLLHWDGAAWREMSRPPYGGYTGVSLSANDLWVPAWTDTGEEYVQQWDGTQWHAYSVGIKNFSSLNGMAVVSDTDIWLVGRSGLDAMAVHWNGRRWRTVPLPDLPAPDGAEAALTGVVALSSADVWAVGEYNWLPPDQSRQYRTVVMHWDGESWTPIAAPAGQHSISEVAADGAGGIWIVQQAPEVAPLFAKAELVRYTGGAWQSYPVSGMPDDRLLEEAQLSNVPGTQSMWGAARFAYPYAYDWRDGMISYG